jgi:hypothetical protein
MNFLKNCSLRILLFLSILVLSSCATQRFEIHYYEGNLEEMLQGLRGIRSMKASFSIEFDKGDGLSLKGEGILDLSEDTLDLQVYSMGFLVAEVTADQSGIKSNPSADRNKLLLLVDGLRNSLLWWTIEGYDIRDEGEYYLLKNSWKRLYIDKDTKMPLRQTIDLEEGRQLEVFYYEPSLYKGRSDRSSDMIFPSRIRIELSRYSVDLRMKEINVEVKGEGNLSLFEPQVYCNSLNDRLINTLCLEKVSLEKGIIAYSIYQPRYAH